VAAGATPTDAGEAKLAAAHQALLKTRGLQFDFGPATAFPKPPHWLLVLGRWLEAAAPVLKYVFWIGVIAGVAWILWIALRDLVPAGYGRRKAQGPPADWRPDVAEARALLEEADALAAAGRFAEAIHILLFRSIEDIAAKRPGALSRALTSREIVAATPMPETARSAFGRIAEDVERTFFGGRAADAADFRRARGDYEAFAFAEGWR
jgi:hypothetical protein